MASVRSKRRLPAAKPVPRRSLVLGSIIRQPAMIALALLFSACGAWAAGDAKAGLQLAQRWCTSCHVVDAAGHGTDAAPPFATIAARRHENQAWLRAWLSSPHPRMPDVHLSNQEIS